MYQCYDVLMDGKGNLMPAQPNPLFQANQFIRTFSIDGGIPWRPSVAANL